LQNNKLTIEYDGTNYAGWQIQGNAKTIQGVITVAIKQVTDQHVNLVGSGRTDAGVQALGQVVNFKTEDVLDLYKFKHSLNSVLPLDISIKEIRKVSESFNSRYDAKARTYIYLISKRKSSFYNSYSYFYKGKISNVKLNELTIEIIGKKDFTSFSKKKSVVNNKICEVYEARCSELKDLTLFKITANRFLHGMVRAIVGTLLKAQDDKLGTEFIKKVFEQKDREAAAEAVPAKGLFLYKVKYD
jgi:tRNA pseudouridine38-40 synthase